MTTLPARLRQDLAYALRGYRRRPGFAVVAAMTLALGIGANATMFGVVDRLLLSAPPYVRDPDRVVSFVTTERSFFSPTPSVSPLSDYRTFAALRDHGRSFERVAGYIGRDVTLGSGADAQLVKGMLATASLFPMLGVRPALGRFYGDDDDREGAAPVAVLGNELWRSRFGGDSAVLGRTVVVFGARYAVVGVAPPGFGGVSLGRVDVWLPFHVAIGATFSNLPDAQWRDVGGSWMLSAARLRPGVTAAAASAEATALAIGARTPHAADDFDPRVDAGSIIPGRGPAASGYARIAVWLAAMSGLVLLVACANVANLLLARAVERRREIAVRLAMGAGRGRLVAQLLAEGVVLAALGGLGALAVAYWGGRALRAVLMPSVVWATSPVDGRVFAVTAAVALTTGVLAGLVPALAASRPDLTTSLRLGERSGGSVSHTATRTALLVAQAALSVVLLVAAGLFVRSLHNLVTADMGFDARRAIVATVDLTTAGYTRERVAAFHEAAAEAVRSIPGVERVSVAASYPLGNGYGGHLTVPGRDTLPVLPTGGPYEYDVSPGYFATLGTPLRSGRDFTDADRAGAPAVLIVNESLARRYWPGENPLGKCAVIAGRGTDCAEIVGVVGNAHRIAPSDKEELDYYTPLAQSLGGYTGATRALLVRPVPGADPRAVTAAVQRRVQSLASDLPFVRVSTLAELLEPQFQPARLGATLFGVFGTLALVVAAVGLYGVASFGVAQRRREFGVRMALGARAGDVVGLVLGEGVRHAAVGVAIGLAAAVAGGPLLAEHLYGVSPRDGTVLGAVALLLLAVAAVACAAPAWRATRVDPSSALRSE